MTRPEVLEAAANCVCGQREHDYGTPEENFGLIAKFWNDYIFDGRQALDAQDVAMMMVLLKVARVRNGGGTGDSFVDIAGYAACGGEINSRNNPEE